MDTGKMSNHPRIIQPHDPVGNSPEQAFPVLHAYRHEICPGLCVIIPAQADGTAMVNVRVVFYDSLFITGWVVGVGPRAYPGWFCRDGGQTGRTQDRGRDTGYPAPPAQIRT
jgi:hypothetical protein